MLWPEFKGHREKAEISVINKQKKKQAGMLKYRHRNRVRI